MSVYTGSLKRLVKSPVNWLFILAFSTILLLASVNFARTDSAPDNSGETEITVGIVDLDGSFLSETLVESLEMRYTVTRLEAGSDIEAELANNEVSLVMTIAQGFQESILDGGSPAVNATAINMSDLQNLILSTAQSICQNLISLCSGAREAQLEPLVSGWQERSSVNVEYVTPEIYWESISYWLGFYSWMGPLIALFLVKTLMQDRNNGLPERIGALPKSRRSYLAAQILAAFTLSELPAVIFLTGISLALGYSLPNPVHLFAVISMYNLFGTALSIGFYSVLRSEGVVLTTVIVSTTLLAMLGGSYWPVEIMPEFMQKLAYFSPNYWYGTAISNIEVITAGTFWFPVLMIAAFTTVLLLLGSWIRPQRA